jgi:hypothetical protein
MKAVYISMISCLITLSCADGDITPKEDNTCSTQATVKNYTGLDGCGYVLELNDGRILEPVTMTVCGPPPHNIMTLDNPLANFEVDGKRVLIDYELIESVSICMAGQTVKISCISEAASRSDQ